ncbi:MAG: hypothetical protein IKF36_00690 [Bacilli bacterium]|nr:hypothetical protein [Bacilli bacterium]
MNEEKIIDENERLRIAALDEVRTRQEQSQEYVLHKRIQEDKVAAKNYEIFIVQCQINEVLNKLVRFIKRYGNGSNESYRLNSTVTFDQLVDEVDFTDFVMKNIIPEIETEFIDRDEDSKFEEKKQKRIKIASSLRKLNLEEMRNFLYYCHSLKPVPMPKVGFNGYVDALQCFAGGINPEAYMFDVDSSFMEKEDYTIYSVKEIIIEGTINGIKIARPFKKNPKQEEQKNTNFIR